MNATDIIQETRREIGDKIKDTQNALADQGLERAVPYYLQAAQGSN
jgi:hypothetical protein